MTTQQVTIPATANVYFNGEYCGEFGKQDQEFKDQFSGVNPEVSLQCMSAEEGDYRLAMICFLGDRRIYQGDEVSQEELIACKERLEISWVM